MVAESAQDLWRLKCEHLQQQVGIKFNYQPMPIGLTVIIMMQHLNTTWIYITTTIATNCNSRVMFSNLSSLFSHMPGELARQPSVHRYRWVNIILIIIMNYIFCFYKCSCCGLFLMWSTNKIRWYCLFLQYFPNLVTSSKSWNSAKAPLNESWQHKRKKSKRSCPANNSNKKRIYIYIYI